MSAWVRGVLRHARGLFTPGAFARLYPTWEDAARAASERTGGYDSELLSRFRVERGKLNAASATFADLPPGFALLFAAAHVADGTVRVTDYGGACGEWGVALRRDVRRALDYVVVENEALAAACAREGTFGWARFVSEPPPTCDVFVCSGTLQYLQDPYAVVERAFSTTASAVVLARNAFADGEIFRVHRSRLGDNGFGPRIPRGFDVDAEVLYPHRTIRLARVLEAATVKGWRCVLSLDSPSGVLPYRDAVVGRDLLFVRS